MFSDIGHLTKIGGPKSNFSFPGVTDGCQGVPILPVPRGDLRVKHSRMSRSTTSWVSISSWDGVDFTIVPGRHPCPREIPQ